MINFNTSANPVMDAMQHVYTAIENSKLEETTLEKHRDEIETLVRFFSCTPQEACLLGFLVHQAITDKEVSVSAILNHLELKNSAALYIHDLLHPFVEKDWISPNQDLRFYPLSNYSLNKRLIHCVTSMDWGNWAQKPPESSLELLVKFKSKIKNRNNRQLSFLQFVQWTEVFVQTHIHLELPQLIVQSGLKGAEMVYLMHMCLQHFQGDEFVEVESILTDFNPSMEETYHLRTAFKSNKSIFHKLKLVETTNDESFMSMPCLRLTEKVTNTFTKIQTKEQTFTSELLTAVLPENIELQPLFYEDDVHQKIQRLSNLFTADQFNRFAATMKTKGMKAGITVIFHGAPGTGKTETVYQLAKQTNKTILMADVSTLRSKWVGDSEKNIRQLFKDYKNACKSYEQVPILLFNEADAILGKRTEVKDRGDQMSNSVQNILLEELEKFEGIFIATTNLEKNLDQAFERRILYKIKYEKPSTTTTFHILQAKFPEIDNSILKNISTNNTLTGGQIENIRKKLFVDTLLQPDLPIDAGYFDQLVKQELYHLTTDDNRNPIGFNR
jgi:hypothetical protein